MRVGIIADTHGRVHPALPRVFDGVDHILHAGDIGKTHVLEALAAIAPVTAVAGNVDGFRMGEAGLFARATLGDLCFLITHVLPRPSRVSAEVSAELEREDADVVIYGHSHLPHDERVGGRWFFNPASAGPRRFDLPVAVGLFEKKRGKWTARHVPLDERSETALGKYMNRMR